MIDWPELDLPPLNLWRMPKLKGDEMTTYTVTDCGRPADCYNHPVNSSWNCATFSDKEAAVWYACDWLGEYFGGIDENGNPQISYEMFEKGYDYSGYGNFVKIVEGV